MNNCMYAKYYKIAEITIEVKSEFPITESTFHPKFRQFEVSGPREDMVVIQHHFNGIPDIKVDENDRVYLRPPWAIYKKDENWIYEWIETKPPFKNYYRKVVTSKDHSYIDTYNDASAKKKILKGSLTSLTLLPTDQILLGRLLAFRSGCIMHSLGIILNGNGYLFIGHSSAGKSTMARMLRKEAVILCDDRNIIRLINNELMVYGTWSHGDVTDISSLSAPLKGIFFLEKSDGNELICVKDNSIGLKILLACLIRPFVTREWWGFSMDLITYVLKTIPCWKLKFNKSGEVLALLRNLSLKLS
jgi:hypothetical protein